MGLAALVSTGKVEVLERLPTEIFNVWMDVFGEIKEADAVQNEYASFAYNVPRVSPTI